MKITLSIDNENPAQHPADLIDELIEHLWHLKTEDKTANQVGWLKDTGSYIAMQRDWPSPLLTRES